MYRNSLPKFKKRNENSNDRSSGFRARTQQRIGNISNLLDQINTDVLSLNNYSSSSDLKSIPPNTVRSLSPLSTDRLRHKHPQSVFNIEQSQQLSSRSISNKLPGEITENISPLFEEIEMKERKKEKINEEKACDENEGENSPTPSHKNIETKIIVEQADSISFEEKEDNNQNNLILESPPPSPFLHSPSPSPGLLSSSSPFSFSSHNLSDNSSQMSFIIREKLHEFAKDLRRRTSAVREELCREPTPTDEQAEEDEEEENDEKKRKSGERRPDQASLMSLIGLHQTRSNLRYWLFGDYTCDLIYLIDLTLIKSRLTFMRDGINVKSPPEMLHHYLTSGVFKLDLFSLLPLDILYIWTGPICAWRIFRLLKLPSFWEFFELLDSSFSNPYAIRIAKTFCYMIYIIHCNSCVYYVLSAWQGFGQIPYNYKGKWYLNKWVYNNEGNAYIRCFYFTAAVATSTGNNPAPTNVVEYIYMTFSWMMGVFVFALLLGQIRDIVSNANKNNEEFRTTMDRALSECKRLGLPEHLTGRVRAWFLYTWEQQRTLEEKRLVEKLPLKLQTDLALSVHYNTLSKVKLFQDADRAFMRDLVLRLRPVIFLPGDIICRKGDVGKEMYIVNNGILEVVGGENNEIVFANLTEGSVFGEISLLAIGGNNRRTANIRSKGYSTLFVLSKEDLNDVIKDYPDAQQLLKKKAR
uniref:Cyclic nucleotide-binding domain-containing protein n=1 Tax=Meloidogyne hapla TaxID=6305 RepID=A0A1I8B9Z2_MELHA